jgi:pilus assembly protein Flp/PilA
MGRIVSLVAGRIADNFIQMRGKFCAAGTWALNERWGKTVPCGDAAGSEFDMRKLVAFAKDESGASAIEYALIACGLSIVIAAAVNGLGSNLNGKFSNVSAELK